jgi:hypothetical protein
MLDSKEEWVGNHLALTVRVHEAARPVRGPTVPLRTCHAQK